MNHPPSFPFSAAHRAHHRERAQALQPVDLLVIGGGITGAGIARDAALRGLDVVLVEKNDLASGTSSRSSKLIHGGLRYLEHLEFALVFEAVRERTRLRELAPHLCSPTPFLFPVYKGIGLGMTALRAGLNLYDALSLFRVYKRHKTYNADQALQVEPGLSPEDLQGCAVYYDSRTDDARLTVESALGAHNAGATILSYTRVESLLRDEEGHVQGVRLHDVLDELDFELTARTVVSAVGPWTDQIRGPERQAFMRPTKGVHIVVERSRLPVRHAVVLPNHDNRILFAIPWSHHTVLGTTDTDHDGSLDEIAAKRADIDYILEVTNRMFPDADLKPDDVVSTWAGLRPLVADPDAISASDVSREHIINTEDDGLIVIAGGKLTTYRSMAEEVVDKVARVLKREHSRNAGPCRTDELPLPGALEEHENPLIALDEEVETHLKQRYGTRWAKVGMIAENDPLLAGRIVPGLPDIWAELHYSVESELCYTPSDFLRRRTQLLLRTRDQGMGVAPETARRMAELLGWNEEQTKSRLEEYAHEAHLADCWRSET